MDTERANKRRKLFSDTPTPHERSSRNGTPSSRTSKKESQYSSKKPGFQIRKDATKSDPPKSKLSAQEAWAEAKRKVQEDRKGNNKQAEKDLYDDIDAAHPSPEKKASLQKRVGRPKLDPLKNQTASSPAGKDLSKNAGTLGFFKQFHAPKVDSARSSPAADLRKKKLEHDDERGNTGAHEARAGAEMDGENDFPVQQPKGWASGQKPKTFEDEIRELEAAARQEAANENDIADDGEQATKRRSTARKRKAQMEREVKPAAQDDGDARETDQKKRRPKTQSSGAVSKLPEADSDDEAVARDNGDAMEIDVDGNGDGEASPPQRGQAPVPLPAVAPSKKAQPAGKLPKSPLPKHVFTADEMRGIQTQVLEKLTGKRPIPLTNLADEYAKVSQLVEQTVTAGESNSVLLIGARGSGKTALVNQIIREQAIENADSFHVVRLNGFIHTDDKIALREIWRQLGREMELESEEAGGARNYADTLTTLLALLSTPTEQGREQADGHITKSVIFILDEFELFATHPRQTLLYNLFDIAQSRKAPIAVLGLTTRIDVSEALEKRVKSRFSHRYVHLGLPKSFAAFQETCKATLLAEGDDYRSTKCCENWNALVEVLLATDVLTNHLRRLFYTTKSVPEFTASMLMSIATLPIPEKTPFSDGHIDTHALLHHLSTTLSSSSALAPPDSKLTLLATLSQLQLALLICAARLTNIYNTELISFLLVYEEYKVLASKARLQATSASGAGAGVGARISGKDVARDAWEGLVECGLILCDARGGKGGSGRVDVGLEEIGMSGVELGGWARWCREI